MVLIIFAVSQRIVWKTSRLDIPKFVRISIIASNSCPLNGSVFTIASILSEGIWVPGSLCSTFRSTIAKKILIASSSRSGSLRSSFIFLSSHSPLLQRAFIVLRIVRPRTIGRYLAECLFSRVVHASSFLSERFWGRASPTFWESRRSSRKRIRFAIPWASENIPHPISAPHLCSMRFPRSDVTVPFI